MEMGTQVLDGVDDAVTISAASANGSPQVSVVLPCLNEAQSVGLCTREALDIMGRYGIDGEVVVVDNGSTDGSPAIAASAGARVIHEERRGYGRALKTGIVAAKGSIIVMADADWSYDFAKLPELINPINAGWADVVVGSRLSDATRDTMPMLHKYVGTPLLTFLVRRAAGAPVTDSQSGFRAFRRDVAIGLGLRSNGMEFASEMLIRAGHRGLRVIDVQTGYRERIGQSKLNTFPDGWRHLQLILLMAPQLLLLTPGIVSFIVGFILSGFTLISPSGLAIGSVKWQPIFFSTITLVLGLQSALIGAVLANQSHLTATGTGRRFAFVSTRKFHAACGLCGVLALMVGIGIDVFLFIYAASASHGLARALALASVAQSLMIMGASLVSFGLIMRWLRWQAPAD